MPLLQRHAASFSCQGSLRLRAEVPEERASLPEHIGMQSDPVSRVASQRIAAAPGVLDPNLVGSSLLRLLAA
eukprot:5767080-Lingulodinium_polyedra.AAC.1